MDWSTSNGQALLSSPIQASLEQEQILMLATRENSQHLVHLQTRHTHRACASSSPAILCSQHYSCTLLQHCILLRFHLRRPKVNSGLCGIHKLLNGAHANSIFMQGKGSACQACQMRRSTYTEGEVCDLLDLDCWCPGLSFWPHLPAEHSHKLYNFTLW